MGRRRVNVCESLGDGTRSWQIGRKIVPPLRGSGCLMNPYPGLTSWATVVSPFGLDRGLSRNLQDNLRGRVYRPS